MGKPTLNGVAGTKQQKVFQGDGYHVLMVDKKAAKKIIFNKMLEWFKEHECWAGEVIMQCDAPQLTSAETLAEIADEIFETVYDE